jgi:Matrixin
MPPLHGSANPCAVISWRYTAVMSRAVLVGLLLTSAGAPLLHKQSPSSPRWPPRASIGVWLDARSAPPVAATLVERALATWTRAGGGRFVLKSESSRDAAAIRVRFAQADGVYGETSPRIDRATGFITSADVLIADIPGDAIQQRIVIYLTALHELGHALGLPHTDAFDDIMYSFRRPDDGARYFGAYRRRLGSSGDIGSEKATGLSPADITALRSVYGS